MAHLNFENGRTIMWLIVLEAAAALAVLVGLVWWTMFSGRRGGERQDEAGERDAPDGRAAGDAMRSILAAADRLSSVRN